MILLNAIQCKMCKDVVVSRSCYDFVHCGCGAVAVDGGTEMPRKIGMAGSWVDLTVTHPDKTEEEEKFVVGEVVTGKVVHKTPTNMFLSVNGKTFGYAIKWDQLPEGRTIDSYELGDTVDAVVIALTEDFTELSMQFGRVYE